MLPRYIIVGVFSALISQGNIATALPQESQFNARFEHIADSKAAAVKDTRAADGPESGALTRRTAPEYMDPEVAALISRELEKRIPWYSVISTVSSCISLYKVGKELVEWVPKANVGKVGSRPTAAVWRLKMYTNSQVDR